MRHAPALSVRGGALAVAGLLLLVIAVVSWLAGSPTIERRAVLAPRIAVVSAVHVWRFVYRAHDGSPRSAYVVLPAWYGARRHPPLPLVISPHGRGVSGRANVRLWGNLPGVGSFAVVSPDGEGPYSWGDPGQISDLAAMPHMLGKTMPWLRVDPRRVYAVGGSMGGQETLLLVAEHPRMLAGAAAFDSVADLAYQYYEFPFLRCNRHCRKIWREPVGLALQSIARAEIGGTPTSDPRAYARRSPLAQAREIAMSDVPLELWWSRADLIVRNQDEQSAELLARIKKLNPRAPVEAFVGFWRHTTEMRSTTRLPFALAELRLLPARYDQRPPKAQYFPPPLTLMRADHHSLRHHTLPSQHRTGLCVSECILERSA